jgi:hypothetical protein
MENTASSYRNVRNTYIKRFIIDYKFHIKLRNKREPSNIRRNNTLSDGIRRERMIHVKEY